MKHLARQLTFSEGIRRELDALLKSEYVTKGH
jgi:hypothetical protein